MSSKEEKLSADEVALYDRQIRLWGTETQLRLRSAKLLVVNLGGLGTETVKNLVLGGVNTIEILDNSRIKEEDYATQFFLPKDDSIIGELKLPHVLPFIEELNTRVHLSINTRSLEEVEEKYFERFDLIIATELTKQQLLYLNSITRKLRLPLYVGALHGMFGYILTDLIRHESTKKLEKGNQSREIGTMINAVKKITNVEGEEDVEYVTVVDEFVPLEQIFVSKKLPQQLTKRQLKRFSAALPLLIALFEIARPEDVQEDIDEQLLREISARVCKEFHLPESILSQDYLDTFTKQAYTEFAPVAAILGGILAQDVIQYLGKKDSPINNCLILDAIRSEIPIYYL